MAKQTGIIALRGKIKGQSYYGSKVGGDLVRTINEGMSARVKSSQEYANTRKNNAEFGMCGDFAGAIIKPITQRWRFILDSIATGKMVKAMKELAVLDTAGEWGKRVVKLANYGTIYEKFNSFSKNEMPTEIVNALAKGVTLNNEGTAILLESTGVQTAEFVSHCRRKWQPTLVLLHEKFHGWRSLVGYSPWGRKESERLHFLSHTVMRCMGCDPAMSYRLGGHE